jgi:uncharacterized membrane protein YphA (DoxX/SURF4 family)
MKVLTFLARWFLGGLFVVFGLIFFLPVTMPAPEGKAGEFIGALAAVGYLLTTVKILEILCGALLLIGRFVPLALVLLAPIIVNIVLFHIFLTPPETWPMGLAILGAELFLLWRYRAAYRPLFQAQAELAG